MKRRYTVVLLPDADTGGYVVVVPAIPGCVTQGTTIEDALENARDLIELRFEDARDRGDHVWEESGPPTLTSVEVELRSDVESRV